MTTPLPRSDEALDVDAIGASLRDLRTTAPASVGYGALVEAGLAARARVRRLERARRLVGDPRR